METPPSASYSINGNLSATSELKPPISSQTITTIASINRSSDNEFTLMSASRETFADVTSLIKPNGKEQLIGVVVDGEQRLGIATRCDDDEVSHVNLVYNSSRSRSRCTTRSDRNVNCNKDFVSITDHNTAVNCCKNVNISNTKELNKALTPLTHLASSSRDTSSCNGKYFVADARCEMGVR